MRRLRLENCNFYLGLYSKDFLGKKEEGEEKWEEEEKKWGEEEEEEGEDGLEIENGKKESIER